MQSICKMDCIIIQVKPPVDNRAREISENFRIQPLKLMSSINSCSEQQVLH